MLEETFPCRLFLGPDKILGPMSSSYMTAVVNPDMRGVVLPVSSILVAYQAGNGRTVVPYGGNPSVAFGYPGDAAGAFGSVRVGLDGAEDSLAIVPQVDIENSLLSLYKNQPFVLQLNDASATYGSILDSVLGDGGTNYLPNDNFTLSAGNGDATGVVDTVAPITGAVLTYHLTAAGTGYNAADSPSATTTDSLAGAGLTIGYAILQGNGSLYVEFDYKIVRIPLLASINPSWPVVY